MTDDYSIKRTRSYLPPPPIAAEYRPAHGGYPWLVPLEQLTRNIALVAEVQHPPIRVMRECPRHR